MYNTLTKYTVAGAAAPKNLANPDIRRRLARLTVGDYPHQPTADSRVVETYTLVYRLATISAALRRHYCIF